MSRSHVAYGEKDNIRSAIESRKIPKNCLIVTKVPDSLEESELFFLDRYRELHPISTRDIFNSLAELEEWIEKYYCVGRLFIVHEEDEWHLYVVNENNELVLRDGTDRLIEILPDNESISVTGDALSPTLSVHIDEDAANGLYVGEHGVSLSPATQEANGAMSSNDKKKLDEIEPGAEVNTIREISTGFADGAISVNGIDVLVRGLGTAAFTDADAYQPMGTGMNYAVVDKLPPEGRTDTIYLSANKGEENNVYDEYLYANGNFELVGTTKTDLSDYYTIKQVNDRIQEDVTNSARTINANIEETSNRIHKDIDDAVAPKADSDRLAAVSFTGSYMDLSDQPDIPVILKCVKRSDGYYYASTSFGAARNLLSVGRQPPNTMVYQCTVWSESSGYMYFGVMDSTTYRFLQWSERTDRVEEYSKATFISEERLESYYTKDESDALYAPMEESEITRMWGV